MLDIAELSLIYTTFRVSSGAEMNTTLSLENSGNG